MKLLGRLFSGISTAPEAKIKEPADVVITEDSIKPSMVLAHMIALRILQNPSLVKCEEKKILEEYHYSFIHGGLNIHIRFVDVEEEYSYCEDLTGIFLDGKRILERDDGFRHYREREVVLNALMRSASYNKGIEDSVLNARDQETSLAIVQKFMG